MALAFIPLLIGLGLFGFWLWMFYDMTQNSSIPNTSEVPLAWPPRAKNHWLFVFVILNIFGAGYYFFTVYRKR
jgi:hypothetical protein